MSDNNMRLPFEGQTLRWADLQHDSESMRPQENEIVVTRKEHANIVTSLVQYENENDAIIGYGERHKLILDIDLPTTLVESSPGKYHLYIDHAMTREQYYQIMLALQQAGILQLGYTAASIEQGYSSVRVPWALKGSGVHVPQPGLDLVARAEERKASW